MVVHVVNATDKGGVAAALQKAKVAAADVKKRRSERAAAAKKPSKGGWNAGSIFTNVVTAAMVGYGCFACNNIYKIFQPDFPDIDPGSGRAIRKFQNRIKPGTMLHARVWAGTAVPSQKRRPSAPSDWEFDFVYDDGTFEQQKHSVLIVVPPGLLAKAKNVHVYAEVSEASRGSEQFFASAVGNFIKYTQPQELPDKFKLLSGERCEEQVEPTYGRKKQVPRGLPQLQVRLVYDEMAYPAWYIGPQDYHPQLFVDEFWMTDDQLIKMNETANEFAADISFDLMSSGRWRFQRQMEASFEMNAKLFGEDSEEMLQMRDLFANTHPYLLGATMVVSFLHIIFEFLAFKNDVAFFNKTDADKLNTYISIQSILVGIFCQIILMLYLWDEAANLLVLGTSLCSIAVDCWKVQRALVLRFYLVLGFIPWIYFESKGKGSAGQSTANEYDALATKYVSLSLVPLVVVYSGYTLVYDCHKGWYSYVLYSVATVVYAVGFALMTPQLFINYKLKSVAYLPWRKFIYRALNTFIDDLFSFIVRMPTMHRMSCFRDDIVFLVYLYQRHIYPSDMSRTFDEDIPDATSEVPGGGKSATTANPAAAKKDQ